MAALVATWPAHARETDKPGGVLNAAWKKNPADTASIPVTFSFHREEQGAGRISVQLGPGGARYAGSYLRLTGKRSSARIRGFYDYWVSDVFDDYQHGPGGARLNRQQITIDQFQRRYTGSVVATLVGAGSGGMRCVFELLDPEGGLADGATGGCQLKDGSAIEIAPPPRR
jgi:hypothetical protein